MSGTTKMLLCGALAAAGAFASLGVAEAAPARMRFTLVYGNPFPELERYGEAVVEDGNCTASGPASNLVSSCAGQFSFSSATVYFADKDAPTTPLGHRSIPGKSEWGRGSR